MLLDQIKSDQVTAMKAGAALRLSVIRMLQSALGYKQIELQRKLTDADVLAVIANEAKKRREAIASYQAAHREAQAAQEQQELEILSTYLPKQMSEQEIEMETAKILAQQRFASFGEAMKLIAPQFRGRADGGLVAKVVKEKLGDG